MKKRAKHDNTLLFREIQTFNFLLFRVWIQNHLREWYFAPLKRIFGVWYKCSQNFFNIKFDDNFYQAFHLCNNLKSFSMRYYFSVKLFLLNTPSLAFKVWWITDWLSQRAFISDIPSQMHPSPITLWQVISICTFNRK